MYTGMIPTASLIMKTRLFFYREKFFDRKIVEIGEGRGGNRKMEKWWVKREILL